MKIKKIIKVALLLIAISFLIVWGFSIVRIEIITAMYGEKFKDSYKLTHMIDDIDYLKVMSYSAAKAKVYYVTEERGAGIVLELEYNNKEWILNRWDVIWSNTGSASDFIWPYIRFKF